MIRDCRAPHCDLVEKMSEADRKEPVGLEPVTVLFILIHCIRFSVIQSMSVL